jgi:hypothetical protein
LPKAVTNKALLPSKAKMVAVNKTVSMPDNVVDKAVTEFNNIVNKAVVVPNITSLVSTAAAFCKSLSYINIIMTAFCNKGLSLVIKPGHLFFFKRLFMDFLVRILCRVLCTFFLNASTAS